MWGLGHKIFPINTLCTFGNWHLLFLFFSLARLRKFGKKQKTKRWTPGLLWGYWFRVWSPNPKTVFLNIEQVYNALEKSLPRQTEWQREGGRAFACICGELRLLKSGPTFSTWVPSFDRVYGRKLWTSPFCSVVCRLSHYRHLFQIRVVFLSWREEYRNGGVQEHAWIPREGRGGFNNRCSDSRRCFCYGRGAHG